MSPALTARNWLRERRKLITLLDAGATEIPDDPLPRSARKLARAARRGSRAPRVLRRPGLTMLSLGLADSAASRPPWSPDPEITDTVIALRRLPSTLDGLRVVHLTDIHHSIFTPLEEVERAVYLANRLEPDLVALTGDYVTFSPTYIPPVARALGRLKARYGVYAVLGNHDFQVDADEITRALRTHRIRVLRNSRHPLRSGKETLWIVGVDDIWWRSDDLAAALKAVPARDAKILLCHNPLGIWEASRHAIDLVLSGHTHGGQVRVPGFRHLYKSKLGERFVDGWNRLHSTQIYVSRGIGKVIVPIRFDCPSEIACLNLRRGRPSAGPN